MKTLLPVLACLFLGACAHQPAHYTAPDSTALRASAGKLSQKVTEARATNARASAAVTAAKMSSDRETAALADKIVPKVSDLLRVSPVELRPEVEALAADVAALQSAHAETVAHVATAKAEQATLTGQLEEANAAKNDAEKLSPSYFAQVDQLASRANAAETGWAKDSKELVKLKTQSWIHRLIAILGLVVLLGLAVLYFTGKLTLGAASIASKL